MNVNVPTSSNVVVDLFPATEGAIWNCTSFVDVLVSAALAFW
jgi:hypothetical protein